MADILGFFSDIFGYILNWIYNIDFIRNYGVAIIIFTILIKVILLPITIKQQKTMKKTAKIQEESKKIQEKYKGNQEKINQEMLDLYKREKMSPCSGCFSGIIQIIIFLSVFYLVSSPLTYMKKLDPQIVEKYQNEFKLDETANNRTYYPQINLIREKGNEIEEIHINMDFLGLDLSLVPSTELTNPKVYIIPVLYVISSIISMKISTNMAKTKKDENEENNGEKTEMDAVEAMNKNMMMIMPVMSVIISMIAPLGLALYWLTNNVLMIIERVVITKILDKKEEVENA